MTTPPKQRPLSIPERQAQTAYERYCQDNGVPTNDAERAEFVNQWLGCAEEHRQAGVEEARRRDPFPFVP